MLRSHLDGVLPWTRIRLSNAAVEGMNNKIKLPTPWKPFLHKPIGQHRRIEQIQNKVIRGFAVCSRAGFNWFTN